MELMRSLATLLLAAGTAVSVAIMPVAPAAAVEAAAFEVEMGFPYDAFDQLDDATVITVGGATLTIGLLPGADFRLPRAEIVDWVRQSAEDVAAFYGKFPVPAARILIVPTDGDRVRGGTTWGYRGAATRLQVGRDVTASTLMKDDWVMVHEMIHMALPDVGTRHSWLSEGLAVYVESIARAQAGRLEADFVWREFARAMPQGLPQAGDRGLDNTPTWGRTYWGGALFCLLADIEIRKRTDNRMGLQTAVRAINAKSNHTDDGRIADLLALADKATGTTVLTELYGRMKDTAVNPDLDALWQELGVSKSGTVSMPGDAPLAAIRMAITKVP